MRTWMRWPLLVAVVVAALGGSASAQGLQTGIITGTVTTDDGLALPGAEVTVTSPSLQGSRSATTDVNGNFVIRGLPPGDYEVIYALQGMATKTQRTVVALGRTTTLDAVMSVAAVTETVSVVAEASPVISNPAVAANYKATEINLLPSGRTPQEIAELAPGLTDNTPNAGQVAISGGFAFDNVFMVDGVDVNDNYFAAANNLYIEDAVEETQVLTSGISAEYGRFGGGVVNLVTKRGGNQLSGSFRTNLTNPSWSDETPFETTERRDDLQQVYEATVGGPIVKDKVWFFVAGRSEETATPYNFRITGVPGEAGVDDKRLDTKVTATFARNHTVTGSYLHNDTAQTGVRGINASAIDPAVLFDRTIPQRLGVANWNGVLSSKLFATAQWSRKAYKFENSGGTGTRLIDSPFRTVGGGGIPQSLLYNAPYFDGTDPEDRNNQQVTGSVSYFLSTRNGGSHDIKGGVEWFRSTNTGGNSQSPTSLVYWSNYKQSGGQPVRDAQGRIIPLFVPNGSWLFNWIATRGATIDIDTTSLYLQDRWVAGRHLTFDLGARYERVRSNASGEIVSADTDTWVPRLAASYDIGGDGRFIAQATYAHYSGRYSEAHFAGNTDVGNPSLVWYNYTGPAGEGLDFAPGLDPANYSEVLFGSFPTANVFFEDGLHSALSKEFTVSFGAEIGQRGHAKATFVRRKTTGIIDNVIDTTTGTTEVIRNGVNFGTFENILYVNADDDLYREYQAVVLQGRYRLRGNLNVQAHYTAQIRNHGNFEGEAANQPGIPSLFADFPEVFDAARNFPEGRLAQFQRHKVRLWAIYNLGLGSFGGLDLSGVWRYNSGLSYSLVADGEPLSDEQIARTIEAGYLNAPNGGEQEIYFGERGSESFPGYGLVDFGVNYSLPIWKTLRPYLKFEVLNAFNNQKLIGYNTTVSADWDGPVDALGLPLNYIEGPNFGKAEANGDYPVWRTGQTGSRTFLGAFGFRF
jgi:outer membrane receptor protein involved in Fe transport